MFCMRVMVGVIILYDHVHPVGAFCKTSKIDVRTVTNSAFQIRALTNDARQTFLLSLSLSPLSTTWRQGSVQEARPPIGSYPHSKMYRLLHVLTAKHPVNNPGKELRDTDPDSRQGNRADVNSHLVTNCPFRLHPMCHANISILICFMYLKANSVGRDWITRHHSQISSNVPTSSPTTPHWWLSPMAMPFFVIGRCLSPIPCPEDPPFFLMGGFL